MTIMGPDFQIVAMTSGAVIVGAGIAVSCATWVSRRFDEIEEAQNKRHIENLTTFSELKIDLALIKQEMRLNRDQQ